jgi:hypothetical protein
MDSKKYNFQFLVGEYDGSVAPHRKIFRRYFISLLPVQPIFTHNSPHAYLHCNAPNIAFCETGNLLRCHVKVHNFLLLMQKFSKSSGAYPSLLHYNTSEIRMTPARIGKGGREHGEP